MTILFDMFFSLTKLYALFFSTFFSLIKTLNKNCLHLYGMLNRAFALFYLYEILWVLMLYSECAVDSSPAITGYLPSSVVCGNVGLK